MESSEVFSGSLPVPAPASRGRPSRSVETPPACDVRSGLAAAPGTAGALIFMPASRVLTLGDVAACDVFLRPLMLREDGPNSPSLPREDTGRRSVSVVARAVSEDLKAAGGPCAVPPRPLLHLRWKVDVG